MDLLTTIKNRHSVRNYLDQPINAELCTALNNIIKECNEQANLNFQLILNEPQAFNNFLAHYGKFSGVSNYVVLVAKKGQDETVGYYGEKIVLTAQALGLNTCWVALTYKKIKNVFKINKGEKLYCIIALGYGKTAGTSHKIKTIEQVSNAKNPPEWYINGINAALLAPTAMNQQKFSFNLENDYVTIKSGVGFYTKIDLGIVKYHFEIGAGDHQVKWK